MNNSCREEIDGYSADAFNELVTLRGSDMQTKLRVNQKKSEPELRRGRFIERGRMRSTASGLWQLFRKKKIKIQSQP